MSPRTITMDERLERYIAETSLREHPAQAALREETDRLAEAQMRSSAEQLQLIGLLLEMLGARRVLEIGCFTGYGSLSMALSLPPDGYLLTLDANEDWPSLGRRFWREAGVEHKIELRVGEAQEGLKRLRNEEPEPFDLIYVDADKKRYDRYYEDALMLLRVGGLVALDNTLWGGEVADPTNDDRQTETLRVLNAKIGRDERVTQILLPIGDGLTLARKRSARA